MGRPSEYKPEYADQMIQWVDLKRIEGMPAWFFDFAKTIGVCDKTLERWGNDPEKPEFCLAYSYFKQVQTAIIADNGLIGKFNATMAYNALKNVSGWRDKSEVEHSGLTPPPATLEVIIKNAPDKR